MPRWTLEDLIDFEQALKSGFKAPVSLRNEVVEAARGLEGAAARQAGFAVWLRSARCDAPAGRSFVQAMMMARILLAIVGLVVGAGLVRSLLHTGIGGMNVVVFLAASLGVQWLVLAGSLIGWVFRRKAASGFTGVQAMIGALVRRLVGENENGWWHRLSDGGPGPRAALWWRIAGLAQGFGVWFNLGIAGTLAAFVLTKNVGFYWETTTVEAMRDLLGRVVGVLSFPWEWAFPEAVPGAGTIDATRLMPGISGRLSPGPAEWWLFLLMAVLVWGLLPRLVLWGLSLKASGTALAKLDFQARHHRALWRELVGPGRAEPGADEKPLDGVLVLDVGGSGLRQETMRPFLLQKLRVHPAAWHPVAVMDEGAEKEAAAALALAPAGVVLLAEGWALSPPRMEALHGQIRSLAGKETPVKFLVANEASGQPVPPSDDEKEQWERFVDSLRDPQAEVFVYRA